MKAEVSFDVFSNNRTNNKTNRSVKEQEGVIGFENTLVFSEVRNKRAKSSEDGSIAYERHTICEKVIE